MAVLDALAVDADAGREVFTDERIARYLLGERDYWMDGMRRVWLMAAAAAARSTRHSWRLPSSTTSGREEGMLGPIRHRARPRSGGDRPRPPHCVRPARRRRARDGAVGRVGCRGAHRGRGPRRCGSSAPTSTPTCPRRGDQRSPPVRSSGTADAERAATDVHQRRQAAAGSERIANGEITDPDRFPSEALGRRGPPRGAHRRPRRPARRGDGPVVRRGHQGSGRTPPRVPLDTAAPGRSRRDGSTLAAEALADGFAGHEAAAARDAEADAAAAYRLTRNGGTASCTTRTSSCPTCLRGQSSTGHWCRGRSSRLSAPARQERSGNVMEETTGVGQHRRSAPSVRHQDPPAPDLPGAPVSSCNLGRDPSLGVICVGFRRRTGC